MGVDLTFRGFRSRARRAVAVAGLGVGAVLLGLVGGGGVAHADNELVSSNPAEGASVAESPTSITLTFASAVGSKNTVVATCNSAQVAMGNPAVSPDGLTLSLIHISEPTRPY